MSRPIIFNTKNKKIYKFKELDLEKNLQKIIEENMETLFGVRFLASEYFFDNVGNNIVNGNKRNKTSGRIDSLGLDADNRPVIFEYKRDTSLSHIEQAVAYNVWLKNNKKLFEYEIKEKFGQEIASKIEFDPKIICIASHFDKFIIESIAEYKSEIQLIQYYYYDDDLIAFEIINTNNQNKEIMNFFDTNSLNLDKTINRRNYENETYSFSYNSYDKKMKDLVDYIIVKIKSIDEDVNFKELSRYGSFKTVKSFASIVLHSKNFVRLYLHLNYDENKFKNYKIIEDVSNKGHWGTGNILIKISNVEDFDSIFHFILEAYENN